MSSFDAVKRSFYLVNPWGERRQPCLGVRDECVRHPCRDCARCHVWMLEGDQSPAAGILPAKVTVVIRMSPPLDAVSPLGGILGQSPAHVLAA